MNPIEIMDAIERETNEILALHQSGDWQSLRTAIEAQADLAEQREAELVECLRWYAEKAHLCRLIHSEGDEGRYALAEDGGQRAYAILAKHKAEGRENDNDER